MGYITAKDRNMNGYKVSTVSSVKQGYLHIKRERSNSPVATRVLFKPWQQAYFILRRDPLILDEYKDATLKTLRQQHYVNTIKHVGMVRTSKSQQFAFEVVVKDDTVLLFGCENHILREEWIGSFVEVMNTFSKIISTPSLITSSTGIQSQHVVLERKGSLNDTYRVGIVESSLARSNELKGDYFLTMTPSRMSLLSIADLNEILSWPISNVTYYTHQPHSNQVILIMSRLCHFGSGKLIFESKQGDQLLRCIEIFHTKNRTESPKPQSCNSSSLSTSTNSSIGSCSLSDRSPLRLSCDEEQSVFIDSPFYHHSHSPPGKIIEENNDLPNTHIKLRRSDVPSNSPSSPLLIQKDLIDSSPAKQQGEQQASNFAAITDEEGYVLPNEPEIVLDTKLQQQNTRHVISIPSSPTSSSPSGSDNENELSASYLQIVDNEDSPAEDTEAKILLEEITSSLADPVNRPSSFAAAKINNLNYSPKLPKKVQGRRASEPLKHVLKTSEKEHTPLSKNGRKMASHSVDSATAEKIVAKASPLLTRYTTKSNAFPKQHSISQGNHDSVSKFEKPSTNPFDKLESFFMSHPSRPQVPHSQQPGSGFLGLKLRRHFSPESVLTTPMKSPELDRNTKPRNVRGKSLVDVMKVTPELSVDCNDGDDPPPVPERTSPKPYINKTKHKFERTRQINDDSGSDSESTKTTARNISLRDELIRRHNKISAPPLPPKSKILSSTRSAPIPSREATELSRTNETNSLLRCSSLGVRPMKTLSLLNETHKNSSENYYTEVEEEVEDDIPPEVPCRLPVHPLTKRQHLSTSEGNLLKGVGGGGGLKSLRKNSNESNNNTISTSTQSIEHEKLVCGNRRVTIHEFDLQAPICDEGLLSVCHVKPKGFKTISSTFPKPPKKIF